MNIFINMWISYKFVKSIPSPARERTIETFIFRGNNLIASTAFPSKITLSSVVSFSIKVLAGFLVVNVTLSTAPRACAFCNKSNPPIAPDGK
jgi:hypothetical protein